MPLALFGGLIWLGWDAWRATRATVALVDAEGRPATVAGGRVELFAFRDEPWAPSPTERLGELPLEGSDVLSFGTEEVPGEALLRLESTAHGIAYGYVRLGEPVSPIELGPPVVHEGALMGPEDQGVADAQIQVFGGGPRGVLLTETRSNEDGRFLIEGIASTVPVLTLRVRKPGFSTTTFEWPTNGSEALVVRTTPTSICRGRILADDVSRLAGLDLRVRALPGVSTTIGPDGTFELDGLPPNYDEVYVVVPGLPPGETFRRTATRAGDEDVRIELMPSQVIRGRVLNGYSELPVARAAVTHEHGPRGQETVLCDGEGWFEIGCVPAGPVRFVASAEVPRGSVPAAVRRGTRSRRVLLQGGAQVVVLPGQGVADELVIRIE